MSSLHGFVATGSKCLDRVLGGGVPFGFLSLVFGESGTGKTTLAMQCAVNHVKDGNTAIYVDSSRQFSLDRLSQIVFGDLKSVASSIMIVTPRTFQEQGETIETLGNFISPRTRFVVFDTISSLYSLELTDRKGTFRLNREMNMQLAMLAEVAKREEIAVLITSQVRSVLEERQVLGKRSIEPVAARLLGFWPDLILHFGPTDNPRTKRVELTKSPYIKPSSSHCLLELTDSGIQDQSNLGSLTKTY